MSATWDEITAVDVGKLTAHQREIERWVRWWRESDLHATTWEIDDLHAKWRVKKPANDFSFDFSDQPTLPTGRPAVQSGFRMWLNRLLAWEV